jgi:hypothetical protein
MAFQDLHSKFRTLFTHSDLGNFQSNFTFVSTSFFVVVSFVNFHCFFTVYIDYTKGHLWYFHNLHVLYFGQINLLFCSFFSSSSAPIY